MGNLRIKDNKLVIVDGKLATSADCCCDYACSDFDCTADCPASFSATISGLSGTECSGSFSCSSFNTTFTLSRQCIGSTFDGYSGTIITGNYEMQVSVGCPITANNGLVVAQTKPGVPAAFCAGFDFTSNLGSGCDISGTYDLYAAFGAGIYDCGLGSGIVGSITIS